MNDYLHEQISYAQGTLNISSGSVSVTEYVCVMFCMLGLQCCMFFLLPVGCDSPFVYSDCGAPCEKQCALQGRGDSCSGVRECTPGCYCPQVKSALCLIDMISGHCGFS